MGIKVFKLSSGEEVLARFDGIGPNHGFILTKPRVLQLIPQAGGMGAALVPWILSDPDASVEVSQNNIVCSLDANLEVESSYLKQTSSLQLVN